MIETKCFCLRNTVFLAPKHSAILTIGMILHREESCLTPHFSSKIKWTSVK